MEGETFGRYRVIEKIATGGMGEVYAAVHEIMQREAVIKFLLPKMSANKTVVRRFFNEAQAAAQILHPGIVEVFDFGYADDGRAYIVMEMLRGEPLDRRLEHRPVLPLDQAVRVVRQLAGAVGAAHAQGIVHRDLKPDNIYLVPDPEVQSGERVKVLDFGLAKLAQVLGDSMVTQDGSVFGTPAYMAPEQCRNAATVDHRADLYSIGCIFYRFVTGRAPFGSGGVEVLAAQLHMPVRPPSDIQPSIPRHIEAVILKLLEKDPGKRLQSCQELIDTLDCKPGAWAAWAASPVSLPAPEDSRAARKPAGADTVRLRAPAQVVALPSLATVRLNAVDIDTDRMLAPHLPGVHEQSTVRLNLNHARAAMQPAAAKGGLPGVATAPKATKKGVAVQAAHEAARQSSEQTMMLDDHEMVEIPTPVAAYHPAAAPAPAPAPAGDPFAPFAHPMGDRFDRHTADDPRRRSSISGGMGEVFHAPSIRSRRWWPAAVGLAGAGTLLAVLLHLLGDATAPADEPRPAAHPPAASETPAPDETGQPPASPAPASGQTADQAVTEASAEAANGAVPDEPAPAPERGDSEPGDSEPAAKEPPEAEQAPPDGKELMGMLDRAVRKNRYRRVLGLCRQTLAADGVDRLKVATLCGLAACNVENAGLARRYHDMLPTNRQVLVLQTCLKQNVDFRR